MRVELQAAIEGMENGDHAYPQSVFCSNVGPAKNLYEKRLALAREDQDIRGEANTLRNLSLLSDKIGDIGTAVTYVQEALQIYESIHDPTAIAAREQLRVFKNKASKTSWMQSLLGKR